MVLVDVYKSRNSNYYFDGNDLIRENKGIRKPIKGDIYYVSGEDLLTILEKYNIPLNSKAIDLETGGNLDIEFSRKQIDKSRAGGHFFVLIDRLEDYGFFYSGRIAEIEKREEIKMPEPPKPNPEDGEYKLAPENYTPPPADEFKL